VENGKLKTELLEQLINTSPAAMFIVDQDRNMLFANKSYATLFGYEQEEVINVNARIFHISDESYEKFAEIAFNAVRKGIPVETDFQVKKKDGTLIWIHIVGSLFKEQSLILWTIIDITKRVENENKIKSFGQKMDLALSGYKAGIWEWNLKDNSTYASIQWKKMLGYDENLVDTLDVWKNSVHPDDLEDSLTLVEEAVRNKETTLENIHRLKHKNGHWIWILARGTIVYEDDGNMRLIGMHIDITEQKELELKYAHQKKDLQYLANHDVLTGLPNRLLFQDRLEESLKRAKRKDSLFALFFIDLDHFKEINDSFGHDVGDDVLKAVTKLFKEKLRQEDTLARLGGDEFAVIIENLKSVDDASVLAEKIVAIFKEPIVLDDYPFYLSCSIGISLFPEDDDDVRNLLKYADAAMYKAKENGRNGYSFYQVEMTHSALKKVIIETELRNALAGDELLVYYQAQMNAQENKLVGMEALIRWRHPTIGIMTPEKFLPIAEASGIIIDIDRAIITKAVKQLVQWYDAGLNPGVLALNIAVGQLEKKDFISFVKELLAETKCKPEWLEFEITESGLMKNPADAIKVLDALSSLGIELAVDDFGTGYSSLSYLKKLPVNRLKIDKSFVDELPYDEEDVAITKAIIALAKSLNLRVIAEGVEQIEQKEFLIENGCSNIQGYFYDKPKSAKEMEAMLLKNK